MARFAPWWSWGLLALVLFVLFALAGRPQGKAITSRAELPAQVAPPTGDVIVRALGSLGIAEINRAIKDLAFPPLPSPVREDGPGWRAEIDLPYGVTAGMVIDRREQLASGLRRPLGAVWPEPASHEHAGRLELWVGRADISKAKPPPWPLLRSGQFDVFGELPFGVDVRGRTVNPSLRYVLSRSCCADLGFVVRLSLAETSVRGYAGYVPLRRSGMGLPSSSNTRRCSGVGAESFSRRCPAKLTVFLVRVARWATNSW
jgi:hypothetical protein